MFGNAGEVFDLFHDNALIKLIRKLVFKKVTLFVMFRCVQINITLTSQCSLFLYHSIVFIYSPSSHSPRVSPAQYSLTAESWPKTSSISFHLFSFYSDGFYFCLCCYV